MYKLFKIWIQRLLTARCYHTVSVYILINHNEIIIKMSFYKIFSR